MMRRRIVPHPFVTFVLIAVCFASAAVAGALLVWGTGDGFAAYALMATVAVLALAGGIMLGFRTTAVLGVGKVRSGWPRSRWWTASEVAEVRKLHGSGGIRICDHSGKAATLLVVPSDLIGLGRSLDRGQLAVDQILEALHSS